MKHAGQQAGLYCLNQGWKFTEQDYSVRPKTKTHQDVYGFAKGGAAKGPAEAGFDDSHWEKVELPHDWVTKKEFTAQGSPNQGYKERGIGWYRIKFPLLEEDKDKQILLEFEGMSEEAQIYVNGMLLKRSFSGYNCFCVDMTDVANFGMLPNTLAIRIDASAWEGWWYEGAGIYRNVWLCKKSSVHIAYQGIWLKPEYEEKDGWKLKIETTIENSFEYGETFEVEHVLMDEKEQIVGSCTSCGQIQGFEKIVLKSELQVQQPQLWDVDAPHLYHVRSAVKIRGTETDFQIHTTGFRKIRLDEETGFWLNERSLKIKGFCNHQDHAGVGVAVPYRVKEYRIQKLKKLGANGYRCAHNPDPEILEICDRLGMIVMEENRTFSSEVSNLEEVKGIVRNARNHPSVVFYSVFNEEPLQGTGKGRRIAGKLQAAVKEMDDTRPVLGAFNGGYLEEQGAATILDAVGINYNPVRYDEFHKKFPHIPLMGSETASAFMVREEYKTDYEKHVIDDYDSECALWGNTVKHGWKYVNDRNFVAGAFVWTGFDYRGEPTPFTWPSVGTYFGTYDSCGFEKNACYLYQAYWKKEPMVHIAAPWTKKVPDGEMIKVQVYSNCQEVEVFVNGISAGRKQIDEYAQAVYQIPYQQGVLEAVAYQDGQEVACDKQKTAEKASQLRIQTVWDKIWDDGHDVGIFNISMVDSYGTVLPDAEDLIYFSVKNGRILGVGNGNPVSHEPDVADFRRLFHGYAQVIVKPEGEGDLELHAKTTEGIEAVCVLPIKETEKVPMIKPVDEIPVEGWGLYHKITDTMPDVGMKTDSNDMNSFEPVAFTGQPQPELSGKLDRYAMYRTHVELGSACKGRRIYFHRILGLVYIYLDGKEFIKREESWDGSILLPIPDDFHGKHELTVVVKNESREYPEAGICYPVCMMKK